jgi:pimeloyl-ACP methyl ester carboxylesterase
VVALQQAMPQFGRFLAPVADPLRAPGSETSGIRRELLATRFGLVHVRLSAPSRRSSRPPLVLLHMTPLSSAMCDPLLPRLGVDRLVVAPDRPGFGFSDLPDQPLSMAEYAQATLDVLDSLGVEQFDVLGTHTGSVEATELAWAMPARVRKVVLVAIPAYTPAELEERCYRLVDGPGVAEDGSHLDYHWQRRFLYRTPPYDLALFQWRLLQELLAGPHVWWPYKAVFEYPMAARLAALQQPVMVLAPHDDLWEQTERVYRSGGLPPRTQFVDLPHLGLDIAYYAADEVTGLVRAFLDAPNLSS